MENKTRCKCGNLICESLLKRSGRICATCGSKRFKEEHLIKYTFNKIKQRAKARGISFKLTHEQFEKFCYNYKYIQKKGKEKDSYSIDRIDYSKGYVLGNVRAITLSENSKKGVIEKKLRYDDQARRLRVILQEELNNEDYPF